MNELKVIIRCSRRDGLLAQFEEQLATAGVEFITEVTGQTPPNSGVGSLGSKIDFMRVMAHRFKDYQRLAFIDAWDMLFYGTKEELLSKIPADGVLFAAERNCWPDAYLADHYKGDTPWRFFNGGATFGSPQAILAWCTAVEELPIYNQNFIDQQLLNLLLLNESPLALIDRQTELVYCAVKEKGELQFKDSRPWNSLTGTFPNFIHFNGGSDPTMFFLKQAIARGLKP